MEAGKELRMVAMGMGEEAWQEERAGRWWAVG